MNENNKSGLRRPRIIVDIPRGRPHEHHPDRLALTVETFAGRVHKILLTDEELLELVTQAMEARKLLAVRARNGVRRRG